MTVPLMMGLACACPACPEAYTRLQPATRRPGTPRTRLSSPHPAARLVVFVYYTCYSKGSKPDKNAIKDRPHGADDLATSKFE